MRAGSMPPRPRRYREQSDTHEKRLKSQPRSHESAMDCMFGDHACGRHACRHAVSICRQMASQLSRTVSRTFTCAWACTRTSGAAALDAHPITAATHSARMGHGDTAAARR